MEFKRLEQINEKLNSIDVKGKEYVEVNQRILGFRELFENGAISTEILSLENGICTIKATIYDNGVIIATGHAQEKEASSFINKTSYIENCETSAVGRALGMLGIGATKSIASAEEVLNAIKQQETPEKKIKDIDKNLASKKIDPLQVNGLLQELDGERIVKILKYYQIETLGDLNLQQYKEICDKIKKERGE